MEWLYDTYVCVCYATVTQKGNKIFCLNKSYLNVKSQDILVLTLNLKGKEAYKGQKENYKHTYIYASQIQFYILVLLSAVPISIDFYMFCGIENLTAYLSNIKAAQRLMYRYVFRVGEGYTTTKKTQEQLNSALLRKVCIYIYICVTGLRK